MEGEMKLNEEMAEFIGIFIGDGSLNVREGKCSYEFKFTGNIKDEIPYYRDRVSKLAGNVLNRKIEAKILDGGRSVGLYFCSKRFAGYLKGLGINSGPKAERIEIPGKIIENNMLAIACIKGIFDTDGCFTLKREGVYPVVTFAMKSRKLLKQIKSIIEGLDIGSSICFDVAYFDRRYNRNYTKHYLSINGKINTSKWFGIVGTNNPKIKEKYRRYIMSNKKKKIAGSGFEPLVFTHRLQLAARGSGL